MSGARDAIFAALEAARPVRVAARVRAPSPALPADPVAMLRERVAQAGGRLQALTRPGSLDEVEWPAPLDTLHHVYSAHPALASRGVGLATTDVHALAALELCVLRAELAVVESGAVWHVPRSPGERAAALLAEHLVVVVPDSGLVATLHGVYERIRLDRIAFGWLLCGPSKTADIEQALVLGAHGPRSFRLVLEPD